MNNNKKYTLYLISPKVKYRPISNQKELSILMGKKNFAIPLALPVIAALTPDNYEIKIINEDTDKLPEKKPDIVGITSLITTIDRAYEIADFYRSNGVPVVMGGPYVSFMSDEALHHADSIIIGEAESTWVQYLNDFESGKLKKIYKADDYVDFKRSPKPRWDLVDTKNIMVLGIQATRGCPFNCDFCIVPQVYGKKMRFRDPDDVVEEIKSLPVKRLFFVDDNLTINKKYAHKLMAKLKPLNISWGCQCSIDIADDADLLKAMKEAGCFNILIGFETLDPENLERSGKKQNTISQYKEAINKIHSQGINIQASFVVGLDSDTLDTLDQIYDFINKNNLLYVIISILGSTPGTKVYEKMKKEGRLFNIESSIINGIFPCLHYNKMGQIELFDKYHALLDKLSSFEIIADKAVNHYNSGFFNDKMNYKHGFINKLKNTFTLLNRYYFTKDNAKKELFKKMFGMANKGIVSYDELAICFMTMAGFEDYVKHTKTYLNEVREKVKMNDKGPWEKQIKK